MSSEETAVMQVIPENRLSAKGFINWSFVDVWVGCTGILTLAAAAIWLHGIGLNSAIVIGVAFFIMSVTVALEVRTRDMYGRVYSVLARSIFYGIVVMGMLGGVLFIADDDDTSSWFVRWLRDKVGGIPLRPGIVEATVEGKLERFALLQQTDRRYDHLCVLARGGVFSMLNTNRQDHAVRQLAKVIDRIIGQSGLKCGVSHLSITGPADFTADIEYTHHDTDPVIAYPDRFELTDAQKAFAVWQRKYNDEVSEINHALGATKRWCAIVITIRRERAIWHRAGKRKLTDEQLYDLPIVELGRDLVNALKVSTELGLVDVRIPGYAELSQVVRCSWDKVGIHDYFERIRLGLIPRTDEGIAAFRTELRKKFGDDEERIAREVDRLLECWPKKILRIVKEGKDYLTQLDDNYVMSLRVTQQPERVTAARYLGINRQRPLKLWVNTSSVGQSISGNLETQSLIVGASALMNLDNFLHKNRMVQNPNWLRRKKRLADQTNIVSTSGVAQHYNRIYCVFGDSVKTTRKNVKYWKSVLESEGIATQIVPSPENQINAFVSGSLCANRL